MGPISWPDSQGCWADGVHAQCRHCHHPDPRFFQQTTFRLVPCPDNEAKIGMPAGLASPHLWKRPARLREARADCSTYSCEASGRCAQQGSAFLRQAVPTSWPTRSAICNGLLIAATCDVFDWQFVLQKRVYTRIEVYSC